MQVIAAPSNLGLRPLRPNHEPGAWRAPETLFSAGLLRVLGSPPVVHLPRPDYAAMPQRGTRLLNGNTMRTFNLMLAEAVWDAERQGRFPLVVGGDCSILLGALAGARRSAPITLIHIDGHCDFRHPGNDDRVHTLGAVAGMDLALATGRGETLGVEWPGVVGPLVDDADVLQIGDRESRNPDYAWHDIAETAITRIDVFETLVLGPAGVTGRLANSLRVRPRQGFWVHLDVDVLDRTVMPAVDCPGTPGIPADDLVRILDPLVADRRCRGMTLTIFDPQLDPDGRCAEMIVSIMAHLPFGTR